MSEKVLKSGVNPSEDFHFQVLKNIQDLENDSVLHETTLSWIKKSNVHGYTYNFNWLSRPIIQYPQDIVAVQELIWQVKPDLIIETGIAHGGSLILSASMLALIDYCEAVENQFVLDPKANNYRKVIGIDIDIRSHNRAAIEAHPLAHKIDMMEGSSIDPQIIARIYKYAENFKNILVCLDSMHTHDHVLAELEAYAPLTGKGSYCIVFDTLIEDMPEGMFSNRPWNKKNNPKTALRKYLHILKEEGRYAIDGSPLNFEIDKTIEKKLLITVAPEGYLRRI